MHEQRKRTNTPQKKISIRDARPEDAALIAEAEKSIAKVPGFLASQPGEINPDHFKKKIELLATRPNGKYIVAEYSGKIVGHALLDPMTLQAIEHIVRLTIAVHPGYEEQGIGETLLKYLIEWAKNTPLVEKIELNVRSINKRAIRLYQKLGFNIEGRLRNRVRLEQDLFCDDLEMGLFVKKTDLAQTIVSLAIGYVISSRTHMIDDDWDSAESCVELDSNQFSANALSGLDSFSHAEVIFFMDQVDLRKIELSARHPRNNEAWPHVGIFAQRGKNRPNQIGSTICRILRIEGLRVYLAGLDAINGTPVLDLKPWVNEFGPRGQVEQPTWMNELMKGYWKSGKNESV